MDGVHTEFVKVQANRIELYAGGTIGAAPGAVGVGAGSVNPDFLDVDVVSADPTRGTLTAVAGGSVWIAETDGDLPVRAVVSRTGNVWLRSAGAILDAVDAANPSDPEAGDATVVDGSPLPAANVLGNSITLVALGGGIGRAGNDFDIRSGYSASGVLNTTSTLANTYITQTAGNLALGTVTATSPSDQPNSVTTYLTVPTGSITNGLSCTFGSVGCQNVVSGRLWLFANGDIGTPDNPIATQVGFISGRSTTGSVAIENTGAVTIAGVTTNTGSTPAYGIQAAGSILFGAHSPVTVGQSLQSGQQITIVSGDTSGADDLVIAPGVRLITTAAPASPLGGLQLGTVYTVRVLSPTTVALIDAAGRTVTMSASDLAALHYLTPVPATADAANPLAQLASVSFRGSDVGGTVITVRANSGLTEGEAVVYAPAGTISLLAGDDILIGTGAVLSATSAIFLRSDFGKADSAPASITVNGATLTAGGAITATSTGDITLNAGSSLTGRTVTLDAGGNVLAAAGSALSATSQLTVCGNHGYTGSLCVPAAPLAAGNTTGAGTRITLNGSMSAPLIVVAGGNAADLITLHPTALAGHVQVSGGGGADRIVVDRLPTLDRDHKTRTGVTGPAGLATGRDGYRDTVDLDGMGGGDTYVVNVSGSSDYLVNVADSGAPADGVDVLTINGTPNAANTVLVRKLFVAVLRTGANGALLPDYERINYDSSVNVLQVNGGALADRFFVDDNSAVTVLDGAGGNDSFQFGQMFGADRTQANVAPGDEIATVSTTAGYLSRGISFSTAVYGGTGDDSFTSYSNKAPLKLFGEAGNDTFVVRAFVLTGSTKVSTADTLVNGGAGNDHTEYNINAPVGIDGGSGFDSVVILGTERADNFVITKDGVVGAGLNVSYSTVEKVEVDGLGGNDHFWILSTNPNVVTVLDGGTGSNTFDVGGDITGTVTAYSVEGTSAFLNHGVVSGDANYNGIFVPGLPISVAGPGAGQVSLTQTGGTTTVTQNGPATPGSAGSTDSYTVKLTDAPTSTWYMTVAAAPSSVATGGSSIQISTDGGLTWSSSAVLTFDPTVNCTAGTACAAGAWNRAQTLWVRAVAGSVVNSDATIEVLHSVVDGSGRVVATVPNLDVAVINGDLPGVIVTRPAGGIRVVEGSTGSIGTGTYTVVLTRAPAAGETVTVRLATDDPRLRLSQTTLTFTSATWSNPVTVTVTAVDAGHLVQGVRLSTISSTVTTTGGVYGTATTASITDNPTVNVTVIDGDSGGVLVTPTEGSTVVSAPSASGPGTDSYTLQLTKAPTATVTIRVLSDGKALVGSTDSRFSSSNGVWTVTFDATNWQTPVALTVAVDPNAPAVVPGSQPVASFGASSHTVAGIFGPLVIEGTDTAPRQLLQGLALPTETDVPLTIIPAAQDAATSTNTLRVFNDGSRSNDVGTLGGISDAEFGSLQGLYDGSLLGGLTKGQFGQISGLGMGGSHTFDGGDAPPSGPVTFDGGITYRNIDVVQVLLGSGNDTFTVGATTPGSITAIAGGAGSDRLVGTGGGGAGSPLILLGDGSQDGSWYDSTTANPTGRGRRFDPTVGSFDDTLDASANPNAVILYGGLGNDTLRGGGGGDQLAGGSGNDVIHAGGGNDHIYGDAGFNLDLSVKLALSTQVLTVVDENSSSLPTADSVVAGNDTVYAGSGNDIVIGDHGVITQVAGTNRIFGTGSVTSVNTVDPADAGNDTVYGGTGSAIVLAGSGADVVTLTAPTANLVVGDNGRVLFASPDGWLTGLTSVATTDPAYGGNDTITLGNGTDVVLAGTGADTVSVGDGSNLVLGDSGEVDWSPAGIRTSATTATAPGTGGDDRISTGAGDDLVLGGDGNDTVNAGSGNNLVLGDNGTLSWTNGALTSVVSITPTVGGNDALTTGNGNDLVIGGTGSDTIATGDGNNLVFGDHASITATVGGAINLALLPLATPTPAFGFTSTATGAGDGGANDTVTGGSGDDIVIGGQGSDLVYGMAGNDDLIGGHTVAGGSDTADVLDAGSGNDVVIGDNGTVLRSGTNLSPVVRVLVNGRLYSDGVTAPVTGAWQNDPRWTGGSSPQGRTITIFDTTAAAGPGSFGGDVVAGGSGNDYVFGQGGNDLLHGDGAIARSVPGWSGTGWTVVTLGDGTADGNDYVEGNGGADLIVGGQGQDDLIGGSSEWFGTPTAAQRPDGVDTIYGGNGTETARNHTGDPTRARDADVILGDNGDIYDIVTAANPGNPAYAVFAYDNTAYDATTKIVPRAVTLLDYSPANPAAGPTASIGAGDFLHGEGGDDTIYGQTGADAIFGEGQNDLLIGGSGSDWISGGTGDDGILGDDGLLTKYANGTAEPLYGVAATVQTTISTPGKAQVAVINATGTLAYGAQRTLNLPGWNDVLFGGLGNDAIHGGAGDDAISGAEALPVYYTADPISVLARYYADPANVLGFDANSGWFLAYDPYNPRKKVLVGPAGAQVDFLLNFDSYNGSTATTSTGTADGNDALFGDTGNDWIVGGTGADHLYGGFGNDVLSADDDLATNAGANEAPDTAAKGGPSYDDIAFGGGGRDALLANNTGDRLIDWVGNFNQYLVPWSPFGAPQISRTLQPALFDFLYALGKADGSDQGGSGDPARNGEPYGELAAVNQHDAEWADQTGGPSFPMPGTTSGSRTAVGSTTGTTAATDMLVDGGTWTSSGGVYSAAPVSGADAVSLLPLADQLPLWFEVAANLAATAGTTSNAYIVFDYHSATDFKFAGFSVTAKALQIGARTATGWQVLASRAYTLTAGTSYAVLVTVAQQSVSLGIGGVSQLTYAFPGTLYDAARPAAGLLDPLWAGQVGVAGTGSAPRMTNLIVQTLPPTTTVTTTRSFPVTGSYTTVSGTWTGNSSTINVTPANISAAAITLSSLKIAPYASLTITTWAATSKLAGVVFDYYDAQNFKYAAVDATGSAVVIGHVLKGIWTVDYRAVVQRNTTGGNGFPLQVDLSGGSVVLSSNGKTLLNAAYSTTVVSGATGLFASGGPATFGSLTLQTNDPTLKSGAQLLTGTTMATSAASSASAPAALTDAELDRVVAVALRMWRAAGASQAQLAALTFSTAELPNATLGAQEGTRITLDRTAAGAGWYTQTTDAKAFTGAGATQTATAGSPAAGHYDLLTVLLHEIGHALGLDHGTSTVYGDVMRETLAPGQRRLLLGIKP